MISWGLGEIEMPKRKNIILYITVGLILLGCASVKSPKVPNPRPVDKYETELDYYIDKFEREFGIKVEFPVKFGTRFSRPTVIGVCYTRPYNRHVVINKKWWRKNKSPASREVLMYHELSHCSPANVKHDSRRFYSYSLYTTCPASIMYPRDEGRRTRLCFYSHRARYIKDLKRKLYNSKYREYPNKYETTTTEEI